MDRRKVIASLAAALLFAALVAPVQARTTGARHTFFSPIRELPPSLVYVASTPTNSISAYASDSSGNASPILTIAGSRTGLDGPVGLTFDSAGRLYVVNHGASSSVTVYAPFVRGNVAPLSTLAGPQTDLNAVSSPPDYPTGAIAVDLAHDRMFVARVSQEQVPLNGTVLVFAATASGNQAPIGSIGQPDGIAATLYGAWTSPSLGFEPGAQELLVGTNLNACCNSSDGWDYYRAGDLAVGNRFSYAENDGLLGFAVAPASGDVVADWAATLDVWPANVTGSDSCWGAGPPCVADVPWLVLSDPLGVGFSAVAVDAGDTIWGLSGSSTLEAFPRGSTAPRTITGLIGAAAIAVMPLPRGAPCSRPGLCGRSPISR